MQTDVQPSGARPKSVMRQRNFALLFWGDFVSNIGNMFYSFAVSFYILELSGNDALLQGVFLAVGGAVRLLLSPLGGVLADRWSKRKIIYITDFIRGGTIFAVGAAVFLMPGNSAAQIGVLFAANVLLSINGALFSAASGSIIRFIVPEEQLGSAASYFSTSQSVVSIIGVLLASVFYAAFGFVWVVVLDGISYIASAISEIFIRCEHTPREDALTVRAALGDMKEGFVYIYRLKPIFAVTIVALGLNFFLNPLTSNGIVYFCNTCISGDYLFSALLAKESWMAVIDTVLSVGMLITSVILGARSKPTRCGRTIKGALAFASVTLIVLAACYFLVFRAGAGLNGFLIALLVGFFALGALMPGVNIPLSVAFMKTVDPAMQGKAQGMLSTLSQALIPVASFFAGLIIRFAGLGGVFVFSAAGFAAVTLYAMFNKSIDAL